jgi:two-component system, chemotaxis family, CheB/CheR fusion protein
MGVRLQAQMAEKSRKARSRGSAARAGVRSDTPAAKSVRVGVVCIGASAGGLEAFTSLLKEMPADTGMAFVFVQHLSPGHTSMLADILARATRMPVCEVRDEPTVQANNVYVIPPGRTMIIKGGRLSLGPRAEGQHHPVDVFMTSLAEDQGHRAIGVVLSGTATDGTIGLASIKEVGGITFAQDDSAQHDGMPRSAIAAGVVDVVLPPQRIAQEIVRIARHPYVAERSDLASVAPDIEDQILALVRQESGVDFSQYKSNTLHRRIKRRMVLLRMSRLEEYATYLRKNPTEVEALYQDILISVTNFFRNPEAFEALKTRVFPRLFKDRSRQDPLRVWVLGCSTGEEPYSLAIALTEYAADLRVNVPITIYATDLNNASVEKSRIGLYPKSIAHDVSAERLRRFFVEADGGYRVTKPIRDLCIFARHNVLADPPFSRMDLISCRNVMIYMEPALQRKLMPILHYALKPSGSLFLGPSETIGSNRELFEAEDAKSKIYSKKPQTLRLDQSFPLLPHSARYAERSAENWRDAPQDVQKDLQREAERVLLTRYVPAGVLVSSELEVLQFRGETGLYLTPAPGKASLNVLKMAREGLLVSLRALLQRARKEDASVRETNVRVKTNGGYHDIAVSVIPIGRATSTERCYWILFEATPEADGVAAPPARAARDKKAPASQSAAQRRAEEEKERQVARLTQELGATRDYLQSVIEQQEAANEELQSANEEVQSANEELQSINEELETSKEEIQSSNEELTTVNEELQNRNEELNRVNNDLNNLFSSVQMAIVMVWPDLRIRRFTPMAEKLFNLIAADIGRPIGDIQLNLNISNFKAQLTEVIDTVTVKELEVQDKQARWYLLRIRPYRTLDNKIDGAVIALVDIDMLKQSQDVLQRHARILEETHDAVLVRELDGTIVYWNRGAELLYGYSRSEAQLRLRHDLLGGTEQQRKVVDMALSASGRWNGELVQRTHDGREIVVENTQVLFTEGERTLVLETSRDISERRRLEASLRGRVEELASADRHKNEFLALLAHELRNPLAPLRNATQIMRRSEPQSAEASTARDVIDRQVATLSRLVDDLVDAAHISRGHVKLRTQPVDLQQIVRQALATTQPLMESRRHRLELKGASEPLMVDGDPVRLEQVFVNLLSNAAKYTAEGGEIAATIERIEQHASPLIRQAVVRIRDNGIGIVPEMLSRVFELFVQADQSLARAQGGLGIGLSLARSLVELHGGRLEGFSGGLGQGSEFVVYLPLLPPEQARASSAAAATPSQADAQSSTADAAQRILIVDDNPDILESTATLLRLSGHRVEVAPNAGKALQVAASFNPTTVFMDLGMPGVDGYQLCRKLREVPATRNATLVAVSGYSSAEINARAERAGFDRCLVKPVDPHVMDELLGQSPVV